MRGETRVRRVKLDEIRASARNPRRQLTNIEELAASIEAYGLLQPVVIRPAGEQYELIFGHRRLAAAHHLGWTDIPAMVRQESKDQATILTLIENLQRDDLTPKEEAGALEMLVRERGWSTRQVAAAISRSQGYVSKRLRVFEDPILAPAVLADKLSVSAAEELLSVGEERRYELLYLAIEHRWDRQEVRTQAKSRFAANRAPAGRQPGLTRRIRELRTQLRDVQPDDLTDADRRELRLLFSELAMLARAQPGKRARVFPPLPAS